MSSRNPGGPSMQCPDIGVILAHFLRQIESHQVMTLHQMPSVLHWNARIQCLEEFPWPLDAETGARITPSDWESHRKTHEFRNPCCMCAFLDKQEYSESRIGIIEMICEGPGRKELLPEGEYVVTCAKQRCGFLLYIERFLAWGRLKSMVYAKRDYPLAPQELAYITDIDRSFNQGGGLYQALNKTAAVRGRGYLRSMTPSDAKKTHETLMIGLLAGVTEDRFWSTFVQCFACKEVVVRETMAAYHRCKVKRDDTKGRRCAYRHPPPARVGTEIVDFFMSEGDLAEQRPLRALTPLRLRSPSPAPTEIGSDGVWSYSTPDLCAEEEHSGTGCITPGSSTHEVV